MAYQLKTTGIAATCLMAIAVDPDTDQIKDFASSAVTADMSIGGGISVGSQTWNGNTRKYIQLATSHNVAFGTTKPTFVMSETETERTVVFIGEVAGGSTRVFGNDFGNGFFGFDLSLGGATHPYAGLASNTFGATNASRVAGDKNIFGWSLIRGGATNSSFIYTALHDGASKSVTPKTMGNWNPSYSIGYIGRRNDNSNQQNDKIHAVLIFNTALTEAQFDALQADWFGELFEVAGGGGSSHLVTVANSQQVNTASSAAILQTGAGTITLPVIKDWGTSGNVKANETGVTIIINNATTGALVALLTGQTTNASGVLPTLTGLVSGTTYRITTILADGSEGTWKYTAA